MTTTDQAADYCSAVISATTLWYFLQVVSTGGRGRRQKRGFYVDIFWNLSLRTMLDAIWGSSSNARRLQLHFYDSLPTNVQSIVCLGSSPMWKAFAKLHVLPPPCWKAAVRNILIILEEGLVWDQLQIVGWWFWVQNKTGEDYVAEWAAVIREIQDEKCLIPGKPCNIWGCRQTTGIRTSLSREE